MVFVAQSPGSLRDPDQRRLQIPLYINRKSFDRRDVNDPAPPKFFWRRHEH
jgi:hypothetical protein